MSDRLDVIPAPLLGVEPEEAPTRRVIDLSTNVALAPVLPEGGPRFASTGRSRSPPCRPP